MTSETTAQPPMPRSRTAEKVSRFTESVIREMTRLAHEHKAVNLSQGFPDFPAPEAIKEAACAAIREDVNQYSITWGSRPCRAAIAADVSARHGLSVDPERQVTVCCGSTEAMIATLLGILNPGDEVITFEPYYENYNPDCILAGATQTFVRLRPPSRTGRGSPDWSFDPDELARAFTNRTRAIIINTPNNPTGKVFTREELILIARLCQQWDVIAVTDEIYEHIVFDGAVHVPMAAIDGMADRTVTISSLSKTYSVTGWRVGWAVAPADLTTGIRKVHDFLTVGAASPLQAAAVTALQSPASYYRDLAGAYARRRDRLVGILDAAGFKCFQPRGAYYVMADVQEFGFPDDVTLARHLVTEIGVASVPGSSFFRDPADGRHLLRFCFCKKEETFAEAERRLTRLKSLT